MLSKHHKDQGGSSRERVHKRPGTRLLDHVVQPPVNMDGALVRRNSASRMTVDDTLNTVGIIEVTFHNLYGWARAQIDSMLANQQNVVQRDSYDIKLRSISVTNLTGDGVILDVYDFRTSDNHLDQPRKLCNITGIPQSSGRVGCGYTYDAPWKNTILDTTAHGEKTLWRIETRSGDAVLVRIVYHWRPNQSSVAGGFASDMLSQILSNGNRVGVPGGPIGRMVLTKYPSSGPVGPLTCTPPVSLSPSPSVGVNVTKYYGSVGSWKYVVTDVTKRNIARLRASQSER